MSRRSRVMILSVLVLGSVIAAFVAIRLTLAPNDLAQAEQAIERRDFRAAGELLDRYLSDYPRDLDARLLAARSARRRGDYDDANKHLQAFEREGGPQQALRFEYQLLRFEQGELADSEQLLTFCEAKPDEVEVRSILEAVIAGNLNVLARPLTPHNPMPNLAIPPIRHARTAIGLWFRLASTSAERVQGFVWRARFRELAHEHAGAIEDIVAGLALQPDHYELRVYWAFFIAQEAPRESLEHFEALARQYPDDAFVRRARASGYRGTGRLEESRELLDAILAANPSDVYALLERGQVELDALRFVEAERWLRQALSLAPDLPSVHRTLGRCLQLQGRTDEAKRTLARVQELEAEQKNRMTP